MLNLIETQISRWGLPESSSHLISTALLIAAILLLSYLANLISKGLLLKSVRTLARHTKTQWDDVLIEKGVFSRLSQLVPAFIIYALATLPFPDSPNIADLIRHAAMAYMILVGTLIIDAGINTLLHRYQESEVSKHRPLKSYAQIIKIFLYVVAIILILATLMNRSALGLLSGLGAMTAIIMLVFKDSILGFVAGIQLAANNMVSKGDWIEMPKYGADGDVIDISLNTVKVQNWDKTITTIPTYALVSNSFKNWQGMSDSDGRRIKRAIKIDMNSVRFSTAAELDRFEKITILTDYIKEKRRSLAEYNQTKQVDENEPVNGRRLTNLGTFRAYIKSYLHHHPKVNQEMTLLVRHLAPSESGLPIELYIFSSDKVWANYEDIQADIFDHMLAVIPEFGLRVFQNPSGADIDRALSRS